MVLRSLCGLALLAFLPVLDASNRRPNIVFILADDLGFNDVSFHGSDQIPTPHIDELARTGVTLNNYHVQPVCSPTRATIMSGRHAIHHGIYMPFPQGTNFRLNISYTLLPQYLQRLGYATHMVGKWHLGQNEVRALPTGRGFDTFFGYWSGAEDYYAHTCRGAYDFADGTRTVFEMNGTYSTLAFAARAVDIILNADLSRPFFLYLALQSVHWPLEAPAEYVSRFAHSTGGSWHRQLVCAMAAVMDEGVGNVTAALRRRGIYDETLIVFSADNGGPTNLNEGTWSSNYPMRGGKNTLWEGGTRAAAAIRGPGIRGDLAGSTSYAKLHATDWLPTLVRAASGDAGWLERNMPAGEAPFLLGDGLDVWETLSTGKEVRSELLYECHPGAQIIHGNALAVGDWKILRTGPMNPPAEQGWVRPPGQRDGVVYELPCDLSQQPASPAATGDCSSAFCLFNVTADPCEYHNLADKFPEVVTRLQRRLEDYQRTAVEPISDTCCGCDPIVNSAGAWRPCDAPADIALWA